MGLRLMSISEIGSRLRRAGRLQSRPLCVYGSKRIPDGTKPSTSISRCVAQAIATVVFRDQTPAPQLSSTLEAIPPTTALFAAFLGYNPMGILLTHLPQTATASLSTHSISVLTSKTWFPTAIAPSFMSALDIAFYFNAGLAIMAAAASAMRGKRFVYSAKQDVLSIEVPVQTKTPASRKDAAETMTQANVRRNSSDGKLD